VFYNVKQEGDKMATITLRMSEEDAAFIKRYAEMTGTTVSQFIRQAALERIEDEYDRKALEAYLAVAERGDFISYEEARKDWGLE
jgi:RHH-type rel operon transcriptional repressor/antitoxin RelB